MLGGRVKTLHPRIHGGILARRDLAGDRGDIAAHGIAPIDLVVVNLYPFEATVARAGVALDEAIEKIDIGGPSMIRSAAKNHAYVGVLVDPADYAARARRAARASGGALGATRRRLARQGLRAHRALRRRDPRAGSRSSVAAPAAEAETFPRACRSTLRARAAAALRREPAPGRRALRALPRERRAAARQGALLQQPGRRAGRAGADPRLRPERRRAVAILKHNTPCGVGRARRRSRPGARAFATDPESPFGGIIVVEPALRPGARARRSTRSSPRC